MRRKIGDILIWKTKPDFEKYQIDNESQWKKLQNRHKVYIKDQREQINLSYKNKIKSLKAHIKEKDSEKKFERRKIRGLFDSLSVAKVYKTE